MALKLSLSNLKKTEYSGRMDKIDDARPAAPETEEARSEDSGVIRARIIDAAARLIRSGGPNKATTRAVAEAASVQAPTIYRHFGDKLSLLHAVAEHELESYVAAKAGLTIDPDPVQALRNGWDHHVAFGLSNPGIFSIMSSNSESRAAAAGMQMLRARIHAVALAGRLQVPEERAVWMVHAACIGTIMATLSKGAEHPDPDLSPASREGVIEIITAERLKDGAGDIVTHATQLRASLDKLDLLTPGEKLLLDEILLRISN